MAIQIVNYGRDSGSAQYGNPYTWGGYGGAPADPMDNLAGSVYSLIKREIAARGYAFQWVQLPESYKAILQQFPLEAPGYYLELLVSENKLTQVPMRVLDSARDTWEGYGDYGVVASARNIQRMQSRLKTLQARRARVRTKIRKRKLDKKIKALSAKIRKASQKTRKIAERRRAKGKKVSAYRQRSLSQAKKVRKKGSKSAMKPGTERLKRKYPWAFRSSPPKWFLRKKSPSVRNQAWQSMSPSQRITRFQQRQGMKKIQQGGGPKYQSPPQVSPYEPNGLAAEQDYSMEAGVPSADMMSPYDQDEAMTDAEFDAGIDVDGELLEMGESRKPNLMPLYIGLGVVGIGVAVFAATKQKKKKTRTKKTKKVTFR